MVKKVFFTAGAALSLVVLAACSPTTKLSQAEMELARRPITEANALLAQSALRAAGAQESLVRIQTARTAPAPAAINENMAGVPEALRRPTTVQWSGPGDKPVQEIAEIVGYGFRVVGNPPATLPMVSISVNGVPAVKALEDIGNQVQPFAQVYVDVPNKRIEYRYFPVAGGSAPAARPGMSK